MDVSSRFHAIAINRYANTTSFAILYYDYILTMVVEIRFYWKSSWTTWGSVFFFLNRYSSLLGHIPIIFESFIVSSEQRCRQLQLFHQVFALFNSAFVTILLIIRTYALYGRSFRILIMLLVTSSSTAAIGTWAVLRAQHLPNSSQTVYAINVGCNTDVSETQGNYFIAAWGCMMLLDTVVFVATILRRLRVGAIFENGLYALMFRDGAIYYGILVGLYLCNILTFSLADPPYKGLTVTATNVLSSVMMNRLMLNLRDPAASGSPQYITSMSQEDVDIHDIQVESGPHPFWTSQA